MTSSKIFCNHLCFSNENKFPCERPQPNLIGKTDFSLSCQSLLPKIHKANSPGRPVISSINSQTSGISKFVDYYNLR